MKKTILLIVSLVSTISIAQGPVLEGTWYLHSYEYDLGDFVEIKDITPHITPTIVFDEFYNFQGIVCNEYGGEFTYNEIDDNFTLTFFDICLCGTCNNPPQSHIDVENDYFDFFGTFPHTFEYDLFTETATGQEVLQLEPAPGFIITYRDVSPFLAVPENSLLNVAVFPNPTENILTIQSKKNPIEKAIIYSITGKPVKEIVAVENKIDLSTLTEGVYFIEIISGKNRSIQKLIKK